MAARMEIKFTANLTVFVRTNDRRAQQSIYATALQLMPSISGDRKHTKPKRQKTFEYKDVAQARDYANMAKSTKTETNWTA
jgi:hypothetical protein